MLQHVFVKYSVCRTVGERESPLEIPCKVDRMSDDIDIDPVGLSRAGGAQMETNGPSVGEPFRPMPREWHDRVSRKQTRVFVDTLRKDALRDSFQAWIRAVHYRSLHFRDVRDERRACGGRAEGPSMPRLLVVYRPGAHAAYSVAPLFLLVPVLVVPGLKGLLPPLRIPPASPDQVRDARCRWLADSRRARNSSVTRSKGLTPRASRVRRDKARMCFCDCCGYSAGDGSHVQYSSAKPAESSCRSSVPVPVRPRGGAIPLALG